MYKCEICGRQVPPEVRQTLIPVDTRPTLEHPGLEIAREARACPTCAEIADTSPEAVVAAFWRRERAAIKKREAILVAAKQRYTDSQGRLIEAI